MSLCRRTLRSIFTAATLLPWVTAALCQQHGAVVEGFPSSTGSSRKHLDLSLREPGREESIIVHGRRFKLAPAMNYGDELAPWESERRHHDVMTGGDISPFGNAYAIGSPLGSDERNNETGGPYTVSRHN